jgi:hypothetical protein
MGEFKRNELKRPRQRILQTFAIPWHKSKIPVVIGAHATSDLTYEGANDITGSGSTSNAFRAISSAGNNCIRARRRYLICYTAENLQAERRKSKLQALMIRSFSEPVPTVQEANCDLSESSIKILYRDGSRNSTCMRQSLELMPDVLEFIR